MKRALLLLVIGVVVSSALAACSHNPNAPNDALATGRWTGDGACLSVTETICDLVVGCGHGQFARPTIHADGTFDVDGTYRIEAGPISINPAPAAHFSGFIRGAVLIIKVVPSVDTIPLAAYSVQRNGAGICTVPCV